MILPGLATLRIMKRRALPVPSRKTHINGSGSYVSASLRSCVLTAADPVVPCIVCQGYQHVRSAASAGINPALVTPVGISLPRSQAQARRLVYP